METQDTVRLLNELCQKLGFCLDPDDNERLLRNPPATVDEFTDDVLRSEGMDRLTTASDLRNQVRRVVAKHIGEPEWPRRRRR